MVKMYFLCCSYRTRIKDHGIIKLRIAGLDKEVNHSTLVFDSYFKINWQLII